MKTLPEIVESLEILAAGTDSWKPKELKAYTLELRTQLLATNYRLRPLIHALDWAIPIIESAKIEPYKLVLARYVLEQARGLLTERTQDDHHDNLDSVDGVRGGR